MKVIVITSPHTVKDEVTICNHLFANGLEILHLRKPDFGITEYERFIRQIEVRYRNRIVLHDHYELVKKYGLKGIHLKSNGGSVFSNYPDIPHISISCHSFEEIETLPFRPTYCFLSPVFDSISKQGYKSRFTGADIATRLHQRSASLPPVFALGGITPEDVQTCREYGFQGVVTLGYIWASPPEAVQRFIRLSTPFAMSVAGFDPSSGAGVTADLKTFETCGTYGLGICSGITFQNEEEYTGTQWTSFDDICRQCDLQFKKTRPQYIKIGLIESFEVLEKLIAYLVENIPDVKICWDPILKASAGFTFHNSQSELERERLNGILKQIYLITPNTNELRQIFGKDVTTESLQQICREYQLCILWKGGHNDEHLSCDRLIMPEKMVEFSVLRGKQEKHGTGCILSSAITAALAQGFSLAEACNKAQLYVSHFIDTNDSRLGYHIIGAQLAVSKPALQDIPLQYITDQKEGLTICEQVEAVCRGGIRWIQLRMKGASNEELLQQGQLVKEICRRYQALFIINDNVAIARQLNADGVHLGKEDMNPQMAREILGANKIIGATCNTYSDVVERYKQGVDYIGLGPFAFTTTKKLLSPVIGLQGYQHIISKAHEAGIHVPVVAIGGIEETDIPFLMQTGIHGIALSGLIKNSDDLATQAAKIAALVNNTLSLPTYPY